MGKIVIRGIGAGGGQCKLTERLASPVDVDGIEFIRRRFIVYITGQARGFGNTYIRDDRKHSLKRRCGRKAVAFGELYGPAAGAVGLAGKRNILPQHLVWQQTIKPAFVRPLTWAWPCHLKTSVHSDKL